MHGLASSLLNHRYVDCIEYGRRDDRFSNVIRSSQFTETMNGKYTTGWQLIRIPSKTKDGRVQQFCSICTVHPLGTCEEFFIAL